MYRGRGREIDTYCLQTTVLSFSVSDLWTQGPGLDNGKDTTRTLERTVQDTGNRYFYSPKRPDGNFTSYKSLRYVGVVTILHGSGIHYRCKPKGLDDRFPPFSICQDRVTRSTKPVGV